MIKLRSEGILLIVAQWHIFNVEWSRKLHCKSTISFSWNNNPLILLSEVLLCSHFPYA